MNNNERFNMVLNSCEHPRQIYNALMAFSKPSVQQAHDVREKREIIISDLLSFLDQSKRG